MRFLLLLVLLTSLGHAQADLWVDPINGVDQAAGTSPDAPLRRITRALQLAGPGTTIFLEPGEYSVANGESTRLRIGVGVSIQSLGGPDATTLVGSPSAVFIQMRSGSSLEGVTVTLFSPGLVMLTTSAPALPTRASIRSCRFLGSGTAIRDGSVDVESCRFEGQFNAAVYYSRSEASFTDCEFVGTPGAHGIYLYSVAGDPSGGRIDVERCTFSGFTRAGILMYFRSELAVPAMRVKDSLLVNNPGDGLRIQLAGASTQNYEVDVEGTTFAGNGGYGVRTSPQLATPGLSLRSSVMADSGIADFIGVGAAEYSLFEDGSGPQGVGNLTGDPGFVDAAAGDWALRFDSPCVDRADPVLVGLDLAGNPRPVDGDLDLASRSDMGALEHRPLTGPLTAMVGQLFELGVTGPQGGFSTIIVAPGGYAAAGGSTAFGRFFLNPQGSFRLVPAKTTGGGPTLVDLTSLLDPAWIGTSVGFQALPRSFAAPAGGAYSNPLLVSIQ